MFKKSKLSQVLALLLLASCSRHPAANRVEYWKAKVSKASLNEIHETLSDASAPRWPVIVSPYAASMLPENQKQEALQSLELADAMLEKMRTTFKGDADPELPVVESDVTLYSSLAKRLREAGGYGNFLLADSAERLAIFRISGWLVFHPEATRECTKLLGILQVPTVRGKDLLIQFGDQDPDVAKALPNIRNMSEGNNLYDTFNRAGLDPETPFTVLTMSTGDCLKKASVPGLILLMATTESLAKTNISGTIRFFEKGGIYGELDSADVRPFEQRMRKEERSYAFPLLAKKYLTELDVVYLIAIHKDPKTRASYLDMALQSSASK